MASPGYRPRVYGRKRSGTEWLALQERKAPALRRDADESAVDTPSPKTAPGTPLPVNEPGVSAVQESVMKKFEIELDPKKIESLASVVKRYVEAVFAEFDGNKAKTAEALGIGRTTIYRKLGLRKD